MLDVIGQVDPVAMPPSPNSSSMGRASFSTGGGTGRARVRARLEHVPDDLLMVVVVDHRKL